jgi:hypothetical protein
MATQNIEGMVTLEELMVSSLATADALAKLLIRKGLITEVEFMKELAAEKATYQRLLQKKGTDA